MVSIRLRLVKDLKKDPKKTAVMVLLAIVLVIAWYAALGGEKVQGKPGTLAMNAVDSISAEPSGILESKKKELESISAHVFIPVFLTQALPFEEIGENPFQSPWKSMAAREDTAGRRAGTTLEAMERQIIDGFKVACTVSGKGDAYTIVDGRILKVGDRHEDFLIKEIGEGYVVFAGESITRKAVVPFPRDHSRGGRSEVDK